jgi:hypothetical protein
MAAVCPVESSPRSPAVDAAGCRSGLCGVMPLPDSDLSRGDCGTVDVPDGGVSEDVVIVGRFPPLDDTVVVGEVCSGSFDEGEVGPVESWSGSVDSAPVVSGVPLEGEGLLLPADSLEPAPSACAIPEPLASAAPSPKVIAPAPSHVKASGRCFCLRCRPARLRPLRFPVPRREECADTCSKSPSYSDGSLAYHPSTFPACNGKHFYHARTSPCVKYENQRVGTRGHQ